MSSKIQLTGGLTRAALLGVVLIGVLAGAMVLARRGPAVLETTTAAYSPSPYAETPSQYGQSPSQITAAPVAKRMPAAKPQTASKVAATTPAAKPSLLMAAAKAPAPAVEAPAEVVAQDVEADAVITLTGCLQHDDGTFRLKDTNGAEAPKSRSWKSGFLKKRAATVDVVDSANRLRLPSHVGQRVTVTGVLLEREMRARAVRRLGVCS